MLILPCSCVQTKYPDFSKNIETKILDCVQINQVKHPANTNTKNKVKSIYGRLKKWLEDSKDDFFQLDEMQTSIGQSITIL